MLINNRLAILAGRNMREKFPPSATVSYTISRTRWHIGCITARDALLVSRCDTGWGCGRDGPAPTSPETMILLFNRMAGFGLYSPNAASESSIKIFQSASGVRLGAS